MKEKQMTKFKKGQIDLRIRCLVTTRYCPMAPPTRYMRALLLDEEIPE